MEGCRLRTRIRNQIAVPDVNIKEKGFECNRLLAVSRTCIAAEKDEIPLHLITRDKVA